MKRHSGSRYSGFTLVELLVVLAVIAILAALLLPSLHRAKTAAQSARCLSNLHQISLGSAMYVGDFGAWHRGLWSPSRAVPFGYWVDQLRPYTSHTWADDLYRCPGNRLERVLRPMVGDGSGGAAVRWQNPGGQPDGAVVSSGRFIGFGVDRDYDINDAGAGGGGLGFQGYNADLRPQGYVRESQVLFPSQMLAFGDSVLIRPDEHNAGGTSAGAYSEPSLFSPVAFHRPKVDDRTPERAVAQAQRHNGKFNVMFADGHTESRTTNQLFGRSGEVMRLWNRDHEEYAEKAGSGTRW